MKRLALFVFYDKDGFVGDYITYYINGLRKVAERIIFIVNGEIQCDGRLFLEENGTEVFQRDNIGLDFGAWKDAILNLGFQTLSDYDELILCNCSSYGPLYPLSEVFSKMESKPCDFWGITKHPATGGQIIGGDPNSAIVEHIQSYFLVFTKKVINSVSFKNWWQKLEPTSNYSFEVAYHENKFTKYLYNCGFTYDTYVDCEKYFKRNCPFNPTFACADEIFKIDRDPFIKRKLFLNEANVWTNTGEGLIPVDVFNLLKKSSYPIEYICSDLLRNQKISSIKDGLSLTWIHKKSDKYTEHKLCLVCYAYYSDLAEYMCSYMQNMPDGCDLYLISSKQGVLDTYKKIITSKSEFKHFNKIIYLLKTDCGGEVSALLVTSAPFLKEYEAFCFVHDSKSKNFPYTFVQSFLRRSLVCCLKSKAYVRDLVEALFDETEHCGVMFSPTPYFSHLSLCTDVFGKTKELLVSLFHRLNLKVPYDEKLIAPFGMMFWSRTDALKDLFDYPWCYEDFTDDEIPIGHMVTQAVERVISFCAQNRGYFSKWAMPEDFAELYVNNLYYRLRDYNIELNRIFGIHSWFDQFNILKSVKFVNFGLNVPHGSLLVNINKPFRYGSYLRYKLMFKLSFGRRKEHYRKKFLELKAIKRERRIKFF